MRRELSACPCLVEGGWHRVTRTDLPLDRRPVGGFFPSCPLANTPSGPPRPCPGWGHRSPGAAGCRCLPAGCGAAVPAPSHMLTGAPRESGHVQSGPGRSPRPPRPGAPAAAARPLPGEAALGGAERSGAAAGRRRRRGRMNSSDEEKQLELLASLKDQGKGGRRRHRRRERLSLRGPGLGRREGIGRVRAGAACERWGAAVAWAAPAPPAVLPTQRENKKKA